MKNDFDDYLIARKLSEKTVKQYLIQFDLLNKECSDLNQKQINKFLGRHPTRLTRAFLTNFFSFLEERGVDPGDLPKVPKIKGRSSKVETKVMKENDVQRIRKFLLTRRPYKYVLMFDLTNHCALRREEVVKIKKDDFDWEAWKGGSLRLKVAGKGKERVVIVPKKTAMNVGKFLVKNDHKIFIEDPIFNIGFDRWHRVFKSAVAETCKYNFTLHDLRRRRGTIWLDQGVDLDEVRRRLGHASISTTQRYLIRNEEDRLKSWEKENN